MRLTLELLPESLALGPAELEEHLHPLVRDLEFPVRVRRSDRFDDAFVLVQLLEVIRVGQVVLVVAVVVVTRVGWRSFAL